MNTTETSPIDRFFYSMLVRRRRVARALTAAFVVTGVLVAGAGTALAIDELSYPVGLEGY